MSIIRTIQDVMTATMIGNKFLSPRQSVTETILKSFSVMLGAGGLFLLVLGALRFFENHYMDDIAAFITALVTFFTAVIFFEMARYVRRKNRAMPERHDTGEKIEESIKDFLEILLEEFDEPIRENPKVAVAVSAVAGFIAARQSL